MPEKGKPGRAYRTEESVQIEGLQQQLAVLQAENDALRKELGRHQELGNLILAHATDNLPVGKKDLRYWAKLLLKEAKDA